VNLLAHAILSPTDCPDADAVLAGNVVADFVKGKARHALPGPVRAGMALHQCIDAFTDTHYLVIRAAERLEPNWGRYSTVLVDIFFDHLLAREFQRHHELPLRIFAQRTYRTVHAFAPGLPENARHAVAAMTVDDWLTSYATLDGIRLALTRMSTRLRHGIELAPSVEDFLVHEESFERALGEFFPLLEQHCRTHVASAITLGS
jgi:acyl carrier protein phosphodiesterase